MSVPGDGWGQWVVNGAVWTSLGGAVAWFTNLLHQRRKHSEDNAEKKRIREDRLTEHTNGLALELLKITNAEARMLKEQVSALSSQLGRVPELERRLGYFEEAIFHIQQLLDPEHSLGRAASEDNARRFLAKMVLLREVKGIVGNREQADRAAQSLSDKGDVG